MRQKSMSRKDPAEKAIRDIRRKTRKRYSAEVKIRIVLSGLRGEESIAEGLYYSWSKEFLEAGKKRLAGDTARQATSTEVTTLRADISFYVVRLNSRRTRPLIQAFLKTAEIIVETKLSPNRLKPAPSGRRLARQFPLRQPWLDFIFNELRQIAGAGNGKLGASFFKSVRIMGAGFTNTNRPSARIGAFLDPGGDVIGLDHCRRRVGVGFIHAVIDQKRRRPAADVFGIRNYVKPDAVFFL